MADRKTLPGKQFLGLWTGQTGAEGGGAADRVDLGEGVEAVEVQGDDGVEAAARRVESADDAGATTEGHDGDARCRTVFEQGRDLGVVAGEDDGVGGVLRAFAAAAQQVGGGFAAGAQQPVAVVGRHAFGADQRGESGSVFGGERRCGQRHVALVATGHRLTGDSENLGE